MATTKTSWLSSGTLEGLSDELSKIAVAKKKKPVAPPPKEDSQIKKLLKTTALFSAGTGAGVGASMLADKYIFQGALGKKWDALPHSSKVKIVGAALGVLSVGIPLAKDLVARKRQDIMNERKTKK